MSFLERGLHKLGERENKRGGERKKERKKENMPSRGRKWRKAKVGSLK